MLTEAQKLALSLWRMVGVRNAKTKRQECYRKLMFIKRISVDKKQSQWYEWQKS